ncbi:hypothetical protein ACWCSH_19580, partial [Streptosporangium sp. NPDC001682]
EDAKVLPPLPEGVTPGKDVKVMAAPSVPAVPVVAGPVEAAALGNALVQARAQGVVSDIRALVRQSERLVTYLPEGGEEPWARAEARLAGR